LALISILAALVGYMPGQFGFGLLGDGVVDELPGVVVLGVVVLGGVVAVPFELAAFAIAAPPPARIATLPNVSSAIRIRFIVSTSSCFGFGYKETRRA
jgi:hypothetical protein